MSLWPHPTVEEAFDELLKLDESYMKKVEALRKAVEELKGLHNDVAQKAADTIRYAIMQRKNAEDALAAERATKPPGPAV